VGDVAGGLSSATGLAVNPSLAMLFRDVKFRSFKFNWKLVPKSANESTIIQELLIYLKQYALPTRLTGGQFAFNYPFICKPAFIGPVGMIDFKFAVIKNIHIEYSPMGKVASFYSATKSPVAVNLSIDLEEMEIFTSEDYGGSSTIDQPTPTNSTTTTSDLVNGTTEYDKFTTNSLNNSLPNSVITNPGAATSLYSGVDVQTGYLSSLTNSALNSGNPF
jgi:hypothetical protein